MEHFIFQKLKSIIALIQVQFQQYIEKILYFERNFLLCISRARI